MRGVDQTCAVDKAAAVEGEQSVSQSVSQSSCKTRVNLHSSVCGEGSWQGAALVTYLAEEGHSEVGAQEPLARVHDLHDLGVGPVQRVIQVGQFLQVRTTNIHTEVTM